MRTDIPVIVVTRLDSLKWTVLNLLSPLGSVFYGVDVHYNLRNAVADWIGSFFDHEHMEDDPFIRKSFMREIREVKIKMTDRQVCYLGDYPNCRPGFGVKGYSDPLMFRRHLMVSGPMEIEESLIEYFLEQVSQFGGMAFHPVSESNSMRVTGPMNINNRATRLFYDLPKAHGDVSHDVCLSIRKVVLDDLCRELDWIKTHGRPSFPLESIHLGEWFPRVRPSSSNKKQQILGEDGRVATCSVGDGGISSDCDLGLVDVSIFRVRAKIIRALAWPASYSQAVLNLNDQHGSAMDAEVRRELVGYVSDIEDRYPVVTRNPFSLVV